jgi:hypothetical protein
VLQGVESTALADGVRGCRIHCGRRG